VPEPYALKQGSFAATFRFGHSCGDARPVDLSIVPGSGRRGTLPRPASVTASSRLSNSGSAWWNGSMNHEGAEVSADAERRRMDWVREI
jgi:hypothetical protein